MLKTIIFITLEAAHRLLYEPGLKKHFNVQPSIGITDPKRVDAVVYDLSQHPKPIDFQWLEELGLPVVVLTPDLKAPVPQAPRRVILPYPVKVQQIIDALQELGVTISPEITP